MNEKKAVSDPSPGPRQDEPVWVLGARAALSSREHPSLDGAGGLLLGPHPHLESESSGWGLGSHFFQPADR